jgi:hypothetical protein
MHEPTDALAPTPAPAPAILLRVSEAAPRLGLSAIALRSRIRRGSVAARRGNAGQLLIEVPADAPVHAIAHTGEGASNGASAAPPSPIEDLQAEIDALRHELSEVKAQRDAASAIAAAKVEAAERIIAELRTARDRETARADRSEAELAQARKGWLERLLEAVRRR